MPLALRDRHSAVPLLSPISDFTVRRVHDAAFMAALQQRDVTVMRARVDAGHRAYVAFIGDEPVAWGWVATRSASIGELSATVSLRDRDRYLWNFVTLAAHRGRGIYPRLLDAIVRSELREAERCWIVYAPENHASGAGIRKAGFSTVAELSFDAAGRPALRVVARDGVDASAVFGVPVVDDPLAPCWRCVRAGRGRMSCRAGECRCDYQRPDAGCGTSATVVTLAAASA